MAPQFSLIDAPIDFEGLGGLVSDSPSVDPKSSSPVPVPPYPTMVTSEVDASKLVDSEPKYPSILHCEIARFERFMHRRVRDLTKFKISALKKIRKGAKYTGSIFMSEEDFVAATNRPIRHALLDGAVTGFKAPFCIFYAVTNRLVKVVLPAKDSTAKKVVVVGLTLLTAPANIYFGVLTIPAGVVIFPILVLIARGYPTDEEMDALIAHIEPKKDGKF